MIGLVLKDLAQKFLSQAQSAGALFLPEPVPACSRSCCWPLLAPPFRRRTSRGFKAARLHPPRVHERGCLHFWPQRVAQFAETGKVSGQLGRNLQIFFGRRGDEIGDA